MLDGGNSMDFHHTGRSIVLRQIGDKKLRSGQHLCSHWPNRLSVCLYWQGCKTGFVASLAGLMAMVDNFVLPTF